MHPFGSINMPHLPGGVSAGPTHLRLVTLLAVLLDCRAGRGLVRFVVAAEAAWRVHVTELAQVCVPQVTFMSGNTFWRDTNAGAAAIARASIWWRQARVRETSRPA